MLIGALIVKQDVPAVATAMEQQESQNQHISNTVNPALLPDYNVTASPRAPFITAVKSV